MLKVFSVTSASHISLGIVLLPFYMILGLESNKELQDDAFILCIGWSRGIPRSILNSWCLVPIYGGLGEERCFESWT